jgi:hypothetical protein
MLTVIISLFSWLIIKVPVISEILPVIKISFIKYGLIYTGFGAVFVLVGISFVKLADFSDKSKIKRAEKKALKKAEDEDEKEYSNLKTNNRKNVKSDSFSVTGKIPVISTEHGKACHICGHINAENAKFCRNCGSEQK